MVIKGLNFSLHVQETTSKLPVKSRTVFRGREQKKEFYETLLCKTSGLHDTFIDKHEYFSIILRNFYPIISFVFISHLREKFKRFCYRLFPKLIFTKFPILSIIIMITLITIHTYVRWTVLSPGTHITLFPSPIGYCYISTTSSLSTGKVKSKTGSNVN